MKVRKNFNSLDIFGRLIWISTVLPIFIAGSFYQHMIVHLRRSVYSYENRRDDRRSSMHSNTELLHRRLHLVNNIATLILMFALCWLLFNVAFIIRALVDPLDRKHLMWTEWLIFAGRAIAYSNFTIIPLTTCFLNRSFRSRLSTMLRCNSEQ